MQKRKATKVIPRNSSPKKIIIGMSGASGIIYGVRLLQVLRELAIETHLIMSHAAELVVAHETDYKIKQIKDLASICYRQNEMNAAIASGSFPNIGMIIAPCSVRQVCAIAGGGEDNLLVRAADVTLKERRRLVLMVRETPFTTTHLKAMLAVTEMGGIIAPPVPAFYTRPNTIDDLVNHSIGRVLDLFDIDAGLVKRWGS